MTDVLLEEVQELVNKLSSKAKEEKSNQDRLIEMVRTAWSLNEWLTKGGQEPAPLEKIERARILLAEEEVQRMEPPVAEHLDATAQAEEMPGGEDSAERLVEATPEKRADAGGPGATEPGVLVEPASEGGEEKDLRRMIGEAREKAQAGEYAEAIALLKEVIQRAEDAYLRAQAEKSLSDVQGEWNKRVRELVEEANKAEKEEPKNLARQRKAWEAVLRLRSNHPGASEALARIEERERVQAQWEKVRQLRRPLEARRKDIREVDEAIRDAEALEKGEEISDPRLKSELERTLQELRELRENIQRASEGGASNERAQQYEAAIAKYRSALAQGFETIYDDTTGQPLPVVDALQRAREGYWADLRSRASRRIRDAEQLLEEGSPEVAVNRLEDAQVLLQKVEEGGEAERQKVDELLARAREELKRKERARDLVTEAQGLRDEPGEAWKKLVAAREIYPTYPDLQERIEQVERRLALSAAQEAAVDLSKAQGALYRREYEDARELCRSALRRGANLGKPGEDLERQRREARKLLQEIDRNEQAHAELQRKLVPIRDALRERNAGLAKALLDKLGEEEQQDPDVQALRQEWTTLAGADERYEQALRFFSERQYRRVVEVCDSLRRSEAFAAKAGELQLRAQVRLWLEEAHNAYNVGKLDEALRCYEQIIEAEHRLPEEDLRLVREAKERHSTLTEEAEQKEKFQRHLAEVREFRLADPPNWEDWWNALEKLSKSTPLAFRSEVEKERQEGAEAWRDQSERLARQARQGGSIKVAYQALKPLVDRGIIPHGNREWQRVQFEYHKQRAETLRESAEVQDWEEAIKEAQNALDAASEDQQRQEARNLYRETIKDVALKTSRRAATTFGPQKAEEILSEYLEEYGGYLTEDAEIHYALIQFALAARDFRRALDHATVMKFVPGQGETGFLWEQLVEAAQRFAEGERHEAVARLVDLKKRAPKATEAPLFLKAWEDQKREMLEMLWGEADSDTSNIPDDSIAHQVLILDLIARLQGDGEVQHRLQGLRGRLPEVVRAFRERLRSFTLGDSPLQEALTRARELLAQAEALRRAARSLESRSQARDLLDTPIQELQIKVGKWEKAVALLQEIQEAWRKAVGGAWEYHENIERWMDQIDQILGGQEVREVLKWGERTRALGEIVQEMEVLASRVQELWNQEKFETLLETLDALDARVFQARITLGEETFTVPTKKLSCFDPYLQDWVEGIGALRERTRRKQRNLEEWKNWKKSFDDCSQQAERCWQEIEEWTQASPPCLSKAKEKARELHGLWNELKRLAEAEKEQPILSEKAKEIANPPPAQILSSVGKGRQELERKEEGIDQGLKQAEEILRRIGQFVRRGAPLTRERNRRTLKGFLEELRKVDACHPKLEEYESLLSRYESPGR